LSLVAKSSSPEARPIGSDRQDTGGSGGGRLFTSIWEGDSAERAQSGGDGGPGCTPAMIELFSRPTNEMIALDSGMNVSIAGSRFLARESLPERVDNSTCLPRRPLMSRNMCSAGIT
jgi:hypothetical protein